MGSDDNDPVQSRLETGMLGEEKKSTVVGTLRVGSLVVSRISHIISTTCALSRNVGLQSVLGALETAPRASHLAAGRNGTEMWPIGRRLA